jgi:hypothetical protein
MKKNTNKREFEGSKIPTFVKEIDWNQFPYNLIFDVYDPTTFIDYSITDLDPHETYNMRNDYKKSIKQIIPLKKEIFEFMFNLDNIITNISDYYYYSQDYRREWLKDRFYRTYDKEKITQNELLFDGSLHGNYNKETVRMINVLREKYLFGNLFLKYRVTENKLDDLLNKDYRNVFYPHYTLTKYIEHDGFNKNSTFKDVLYKLIRNLDFLTGFRTFGFSMDCIFEILEKQTKEIDMRRNLI